MALLGLVFGAIALGVLLVLGRVLVALVVGLLALGWMVVMGVLALSVGSGVVVGAVLGTAWDVAPGWVLAAGVATALWVGVAALRHLWHSLLRWANSTA
jgi:hypothetical protein